MNLFETEYTLNDNSKHVGKVASVENASLTNIQLRAGEEIKEHDSKNEAFIIVRRGKVRFTIEGEEVFVTPENLLQMAPLEKHSLHALEDTDLLLIQVKP
ncbi:AraC family ligand binding domain-containing protein [Sporosarcina oncorhynchi]|uniref:AraC family ligand binding domain-containing protein n=1 Tax=Sporosarcina oncorhynchi TaxID=3056444 RepID=A0ABZ0L5Q7_9BACL|nr:cupin domain-containing protein [Sporosarcina sp. T2O-4]WOV86659.1 AraC family ligand binding domain-containing protein [Sporosarcina sp. T2O-4]